MEEKIYRIAVIGPTGAGKSQFCNFCLKDKTNKTYEVSNSLNSCTQVPFATHPFERNNMMIELIDSSGSSDSGDKDIENLKKFVIFLREKKELDYILLLLKFDDRVTGQTKKFIETLANIFAPVEFFSHLSIVFTRSPIDPDDEELEQRKKYSLEIGEIIDKIFKLDENHKKVLEPSKTFFIDTKLRKKNFDAQSQKTVDVILDWIKFNLKRIGPIKTENLDYSEEKIKIKRDKELEELKKRIEKAEEESKKSKEIAEKEKREREEMEKKLEEVKAANARGGSLFGKIFFGVLSGVSFLAAPFTFGVTTPIAFGSAAAAALC
jgi:GTPase SAR1 family protein